MAKWKKEQSSTGAKSATKRLALMAVGVAPLVAAMGVPVASAASSAQYPVSITEMAPGGSLTHADASSPVWQALEKDINANLTVQWINDANYDSKVSVELASGNPPDILRVIHMNADVQSAAQSGAFWNLGPYIKDYKYLDAINPVIYDNIKIQGQIYGIPAVRKLTRFGIVYRKDWLHNLGLKPPKTINEFYDMLDEFTYHDPNKDGQNDTYGMELSNDIFPLTSLEPSFGVPYSYYVKGGKLYPAQQTSQYFAALGWFHKLYVNKLINQNFAEVPVTNRDTDFLAGKAGVIDGTADDANAMVSQNPKLAGKLAVLGPLKGPGGNIGDYNTGGTDGMYVIPKNAVKTVAQLKQVLSVLNALSSPAAVNLVTYGLKGLNYKIVKGKEVPMNQNVPADQNQLNDLAEISPLVPSSLTITPQYTALQKQVNQVEGVIDPKYILTNPAANLYSPTQVQIGSQLNTVLNNALMQYVAGQITISGLNQANAQWLKDGGQKVLDELDAAYAQAHKKK